MNPQPRIAGGEEVVPHAWPWTVSFTFGGKLCLVFVRIMSSLKVRLYWSESDMVSRLIHRESN